MISAPTRGVRVRGWWIAGAFVGSAVLVAACGGGSDTAEDTDSTTDTSANVQVIEPEGEVTPGGDLVFAVEAETDGWDPTLNRWAVSGHEIGQAIFDQLATFNIDGEAVPYLAESFTPNDDFTEWTITLREGVTFHDGTPVDAESVKTGLERHMASPLTAPQVRPIESVEAIDDLNVLVSLSSPWVSFPVVLTSQIGYVVAPAEFEAGEDGRRNPIGSGPFRFVSWEPGAQLVVERYDDYWRSDADGNQLPYLDSVEFRPIEESGQRYNSLSAGDINMLHTTDPDTIVKMRDDADAGDIQVVEDGGLGEESFILLNLLQPPLDDLRVRQAMAMAIDRETYNEVVDLGIREVASTPFISSSPWYSEEAAAAYPTFDPEGARALVDEYEAEEGPIQVTLGLTPSEANRTATQFYGSEWEEVGIEVEYIETQQSQFVSDMITGNYQTNQMRLFGGTDPDIEYVWWDIKNANDIGTFSLNFARLRNQAMTDAMDAARAAETPEERKAAYDEAQVLLNQELPYLWLNHTLWALGADNSVRNLATVTLPDGTEGFGFGTGFSGAIRLTEVWMQQD